MRSYSQSDDHQPLLWIQGHGFYGAHVIVGVFVASMVVTSLMLALGVDFPFLWLPFDSERLWNGEVWRIVTYGFVNPPSLGFVIDMAMIVWFGREVEKHLGRRAFLRFYAGLYLLPPLFLAGLGWWEHTGLAGENGAFALFIAFATLYPNAVLLFNILAKWAAIVLVGIYVLMALSSRDLIGFATLVVTVGFAWLYIRHEQGHFSLRSLLPAPRRPRSAPAAVPRRVAEAPRNDFMAEADRLLDKIARDGIDSLTAAERHQLDQARDRLNRRRSSKS